MNRDSSHLGIPTNSLPPMPLRVPGRTIEHLDGTITAMLTIGTLAIAGVVGLAKASELSASDFVLLTSLMLEWAIFVWSILMRKRDSLIVLLLDSLAEFSDAAVSFHEAGQRYLIAMLEYRKHGGEQVYGVLTEQEEESLRNDIQTGLDDLLKTIQRRQDCYVSAQQATTRLQLVISAFMREFYVCVVLSLLVALQLLNPFPEGSISHQAVLIVVGAFLAFQFARSIRSRRNTKNAA